jgi:ligand-binding sensor protein
MKKQKLDLSETLKQEFKKDLELFEYFLVLLNHSSPIRNVELMWADDLELFDPTQRPRVNTGDALVQLQPMGADTPGRTSPSPSTHFCDLVHGFGTHEEQTCARSDKPAKERCRATGRSQVYPCHVGLTDIAVPVVCEGRYLGTLFSGQVLTRQPHTEGFAFVKGALEGQPHIDMEKLEEAYHRVPVVTTAQLSEMVHMLEVFARYLSNTWKRLEIMSEFQRMRERELSLDRRELAEMLLAGQVGPAGAGNIESLRALARNVGLERFPDRVLVVRLQNMMEGAPAPAVQRVAVDRSTAAEIGSHLTLVRTAHLIEENCQNWPNTLATVVTPGEMCVFTAQKSRTPGHERMLLEEMAQTLLRTARSQGLTMARVGISGVHHQSTELLRAYHEAAAAIDSGSSSVNWFEAPPEHLQPTQSLGRVLKALESTEPAAITSAVREFLAAAAPAAATADCSPGPANTWLASWPRWARTPKRSTPPRKGPSKSSSGPPARLPWPKPSAVTWTNCASRWCSFFRSARRRSSLRRSGWCARWARRRSPFRILPATSRSQPGTWAGCTAAPPARRWKST